MPLRAIAAFSFGLGLCSAAGAQEDGGKVRWNRQPAAEALNQAYRDRLPALVYFRAGWSPACTKLEESTLSDKKVVEASERFVRILVDCTDSKVLADARGRFAIRGVPAILFYNGAGEKVDEIMGAVDGEMFVRKMAANREGAGMAADARDDESGPWRDTHRLVLLNGNIIDGRLDEFTPEVVVLKWDPTTIVRIKANEVQRVERITIRQHGEGAQRVDPVDSTDPGTEDPRAAIDTEATPEPTTAKDVKERIDEIIKRVAGAEDDRKAGLKVHIRTYGTEGARYLLWRVQTAPADVVVWAFEALRYMPEARLDVELRYSISSPREEVRAGAAKLIGARRMANATPLLVRLMRDKEATVRENAASSLHELGDASCIPALADGSVDTDPAARSAALSAAEAVAGRTKSETRLATRWLQVIRRGNPRARQGIAMALGKMAGRPQDAEFPLSEIFGTLTALLSDRSAEVRTSAVLGLGATRSTNALSALHDQLETETEEPVLYRVCEVLGEMKDATSTLPLIEILKSSHARIRNSAAAALRTITRQVRFGATHDEWMDWYKKTH